MTESHQFTELDCPSCQGRVRIPSTHLGRRAICGLCHSEFQTPSNEARPTPSALATFQDDANPFLTSEGESARTSEFGLRPHRGGLVLALAILGWLLCPVFAVAAWVVGQQDLNLMRRGQMDASGEGLTNAGRIIAMVQCVVLGFGLAAWFAILSIGLLVGVAQNF